MAFGRKTITHTAHNNVPKLNTTENPKSDPYKTPEKPSLDTNSVTSSDKENNNSTEHNNSFEENNLLENLNSLESNGSLENDISQENDDLLENGDRLENNDCLENVTPLENADTLENDNSLENDDSNLTCSNTEQAEDFDLSEYLNPGPKTRVIKNFEPDDENYKSRDRDSDSFLDCFERDGSVCNCKVSDGSTIQWI